MAKSSGKRKADSTVTTLKPRKQHRREGFEYEKLPAEHIRILQVTCELKRNGRRSFSTRLRSFHVKQLPHFIALSYAWPEAGTSTRPLQCNDQYMTISSHVYTALENLCPLDAACSFAIWIDAICLDQGNEVEKSSQIPHMGSIYGLASQVIVWLGPNRLADKHLVAIQDLSKYVDSLPGGLLWHGLDKPPFPEYGHEIWEALRRFVFSPWFRRLWVVQEVCLARVANVLCGRCCVSWTSLYRLLIKQMTDAINFRRSEDGHTGLTTITRCRSKTVLLDRGGIDVDIDGLVNDLDWLAGQLVSKPIDRVFGLLFMLPEEIRQNIIVDYSQEDAYWMAYLNLGRNLVRQASGLNLLAYATGRSEASNLPSWCPDWNLGPTANLIPKATDENKRLVGSLSTRRRPEIGFKENPRLIQVRGFRIDTIACSIPFQGLSAQRESREFARAWLAWHHQCLEQLKSRCSENKESESAAILLTHLRNLRMNIWGQRTINSELKPITANLWPKICHCFDEAVSFYEGLINPRPDSAETLNACARQFMDLTQSWDDRRTYFFTEQGRVGRGFPRDRPGDVLVVLYTARAPFVLRYEEGSNVATLVGEAYLDGCMDLDTMPSAGRGPDEWFTIG